MATENAILDLSYSAAEELSSDQYRFVVLGSTGVRRPDSEAEVVLGILQNDPASGEVAVVRLAGTSKLRMNAAAAIGTFVRPEYVSATDAGKGRASSSGFTEYVRGLVLEASGAEDDVASVLLVGPSPAVADTIRQTDLDRRFTFEEFESRAVTALATGGAPLGSTNSVNVMALEENIFEYHIKGTQTILAPVLAAGGLNVGMDQTDNDGVEISQGITSRSRAAFVVGTDAFYAKCKFSIATVAGTDDCAFGFRTAEAYQANLDDYNNMAALNVIAGAIKIETIDDNAATTTTDTTNAWADGETHTLEVRVGADRAVTYLIDGVAPTVTAAFSIDAGDVVVPFFFMLQANAAQTGVVLLQEWEVGLQ